MDPVNIPAKFEVCSFMRSWDNRGYWTNYVMTSPLTSRSLHRLSVWTIYTHCAVDDFVKIWSNSDKNGGRYSMLKVVMSRLWRHRVTWRHRGGQHSIAPDHFPISPQQESICYLQQFPRYLALNVVSWWRHNWRNVVWINYLCGPSRRAI